MRQGWLTTRHEAVAELDDLRDPNDAFAVVALVGQQHEEAEHGGDQLFRLSVKVGGKTLRVGCVRLCVCACV